VINRFTWEVTAEGTAACYVALLAGNPLPGAPGMEPSAVATSPAGDVAC
jgi:hypothetical protein